MRFLDWLLGRDGNDSSSRNAPAKPPGGGTERVKEKEIVKTVVETILKRQTAKEEGTFETAGKGIQSIVCSDNACPCTDQRQLKLGIDAYLYISPGVVEFRRDCLTMLELEMKVSKLGRPQDVLDAMENAMPKYVCEVGAKRRRLNVAVALADGLRAAETGWVPLRTTPTAQVLVSASSHEDAIDVDALVRSLLAQDLPTREKAIVEARGLANNGERRAVDALEIAIRRKAGQAVDFHMPGLVAIPAEQLAAARQSVLDIARRGEICKEAKRVGSLMSSLFISNPDEVRTLLAEISAVGGEEQVHQFQLVGTHLQAIAGLERSSTP